MAEKKYKSFWEFYPYYLTEHQDLTCQRLHFIGTGIVIGLAIGALLTQKWLLLAFTPVAGYGFAWAGHFFFEKNKPATFTYPLWSLGSDFVMFWHILTGQINAKVAEARKTILGQ